ncbi:MAG: hypothetical protein NT086_02000 [Proteobacteria bacterium]|nr:hypothetical protein [Pseudomonadota bacterium]
MKKVILFLVLGLSLVACSKRQTLSTEQHQSVSNAARSFYTAQTSSGKQGVFMSCQGTDSDGDGNVTCTGQVPTNEGAMRFQESLCSFEGAAGCKLK